MFHANGANFAYEIVLEDWSEMGLILIGFWLYAWWVLMKRVLGSLWWVFPSLNLLYVVTFYFLPWFCCIQFGCLGEDLRKHFSIFLNCMVQLHGSLQAHGNGSDGSILLSHMELWRERERDSFRGAVSCGSVEFQVLLWHKLFKIIFRNLIYFCKQNFFWETWCGPCGQ